jgi:Domain of unknown function (DUF4091)
MKRRAFSFQVACLKAALVFCAAGLGRAEVMLTQVDAMTRVLRTQAIPAEAAGRVIPMNAARGEWEAVQIILHGTAEELWGARVMPAPLRSESGGRLPPPEIYREHYVQVRRSTPQSPLPLGEYPDALVPQNMSWQEMPKDKPEQKLNLGFWVDVYVPKNAQPGDYTGSFQVRSLHGRLLGDAEVRLHVHDFSLPEVPSFKSSIMTGWRAILRAHELPAEEAKPRPEDRKLLQAYHALLAQHRLSIDATYHTYADADSTGRLPIQEVQEGFRQQVVQNKVSTLSPNIGPTWPFEDPLGKDREAAMRYAADWMAQLNQVSQGTQGYIIKGDLDEPNDEAGYARVRRWGDFFNEAEARYGVRLPLLVTEQPTPDSFWWGPLDGFVDIWVPHFSRVWMDLEGPDGQRDITRRLRAGDEVWCYPALVQVPDAWMAAHGNPAVLKESHPPVWCLDYPAMNFRVLSWLVQRHGITGVCYWDTVSVKKGVDVWTYADSLHTDDGKDVFNGDGSLIYPATKRRHGVEQPVASIRLKWLREMMEDYDYLYLASVAGKEKEATEAASSFARGFGDWQDDIGALYAAREKIARLLVAQPPAPADPAAEVVLKPTAEKVESGVLIGGQTQDLMPTVTRGGKPVTESAEEAPAPEAEINAEPKNPEP